MPTHIGTNRPSGSPPTVGHDDRTRLDAAARHVVQHMAYRPASAHRRAATAAAPTRARNPTGNSTPWTAACHDTDAPVPGGVPGGNPNAGSIGKTPAAARPAPSTTTSRGTHGPRPDRKSTRLNSSHANIS